MIKKFFSKGRLRLSILKIFLISFIGAAVFAAVVTFIFNYLINDNDEAMIKRTFTEVEDFIKMVDEEASSEIDDINDIYKWSGWEKIDKRWIVEVYDNNDNLVYAKGTKNMRFYSSASMIRALNKFEGAYVEVMVSVRSHESMLQPFATLLSLVMFVVLFTIQFRKIEKYTYEIADGISILAGGEMQHHIPVRGKNELSMLATNINELASALLKQMHEKQKSDTARDDLITNLAHDIRTPITVLEGYLSILLSQENISDMQRREYTQISMRKCMELSERANGIFEYVRLNSEREQIVSESTNARTYITQRFEEMAMVLTSEAFRCDVNVSIDNSQKFSIDRVKAQRVFDNLLSNIIKYADQTQPIELEANVRGAYIVVSIKNKFIEPLSIEPDRLFERMVSGDQSRQSKSAGLGLSICKVIMKMHGGNIKAVTSDDSIEFLLYFLKNE